jgi:hypothetical protein
MTDAEWIECTDPQMMLEFIKGKASDRKLRLFAVACCRHILTSLTFECSRQAVQVSEQFADGLCSKHDLEKRVDEAWDAIDSPYYLVSDAEFVAMCSAEPMSGYHAARDILTWGRILKDPSQLLRCMFGNPFRQMPINPRWLSSTVVDIAQAIYQEKAFGRMPILADALMDAGCDNQDIFTHCRSVDVHVRGCWVVDLLLGKKCDMIEQECP